MKKHGVSCQRTGRLVLCQKDLCKPPGLTHCPSCLCRTNYLEELNCSSKSAPHRDWNLFEVGLFVTHCILEFLLKWPAEEISERFKLVGQSLWHTAILF